VLKTPVGRIILTKIGKIMCLKEISEEELTERLKALNILMEHVKPHLQKAGILEERSGSGWSRYEPDWSLLG